MATIEQLSAALIKADAAGNTADAKVFADKIREMRAAPVAPVEESGGFMQGLGNLAAGAVRGAGSIGATALAPIDALARKLNDGKPVTVGGFDVVGQDRRAGMDAGLESMGAEPNSWMYKGGKLASEIAGTAGAGGLVAKGVTTAAPILSATAPRLSQFVQAAKSGGFTLGGPAATTLGGKAVDLGIRAAGGAAGGAVGAGMVDPNEAAMGALFGGALPVAAKAIGATARTVGDIIRTVKRPPETRIASKLAQALDMSPEELSLALNQTGPNRLMGLQPTVPQILQNPVTSQLQRSLQTAGVNTLGDAEKIQQGQLKAALDYIAPADLTLQDAANRAGSAIQGYAKPALQDASRNVNDLFAAVPSDEAMLQLPLGRMQGIQGQYFGPGAARSKGRSAVEAIMEEATNIGFDPANLSTRVVPFDQLQRLRGSINSAINDATDDATKAALTNMKGAIDNKIAESVSGQRLPGEVFTPGAADIYGQALAAHGAKKTQFATGPQVGMFRQGGDGQASIQGAEIPGKFFNGNRSQVEDMQAFKRLIGNRADLADEMRRYAITEAQSTGNVGGDLTSKFIKWAQSRSGANRELFNAQELATIKDVGAQIEKSINAETLGKVKSGSDTAQRLEGLKNLGLLESKVVNVLATKIPVVGSFTGPALDGLRKTATQNRNELMSRLLADPQFLSESLQPAAPAAPAKLWELLNSRVMPAVSRSVPAIAAQ